MSKQENLLAPRPTEHQVVMDSLLRQTHVGDDHADEQEPSGSNRHSLGELGPSTGTVVYSN